MTPKRPQTPIFYYNLYNSKEMKKSIIAKTYESGPESMEGEGRQNYCYKEKESV